jgi:hypothetical protein
MLQVHAFSEHIPWDEGLVASLLEHIDLYSEHNSLFGRLALMNSEHTHLSASSINVRMLLIGE